MNFVGHESRLEKYEWVSWNFIMRLSRIVWWLCVGEILAGSFFSMRLTYLLIWDSMAKFGDGGFKLSVGLFIFAKYLAQSQCRLSSGMVVWKFPS